METVLIYDMRAPAFGTPRSEVFATALDIAAWADEIGFDVIGLGEHHSSEDGYNPSPLILAAALAGRTRRIRLRSAILLASCYDPIRLAEDIAVLQIVSQGRYELGLGFGYRRCEFEMYGRHVEDRFEYTTKLAQLLKRAWTGEPFEYEGRPCHVLPVPEKPVPVMLGGYAPKVARAAAQVADGFFAPLENAKVWQPYRDECAKLGKKDPGDYPNQGTAFLWISENPERDWEWIAPHCLHVLDSYARWTAAAYDKPIGPYAGGQTPESIRQSSAYKVLTPDQTLELIEQLGDNSSFYLSPLFAGIDPKKAWEMLRLYERDIHPHIPRSTIPTWRHTP